MALYTLYDKAAAVEAGSTENIPSIKGNPTGLLQVKNAGTATVVLEGRLIDDDTKADWEEIYTVTDASELRSVSLTPYMRVNITAQTSTPQVSVYVHA